MNQHPASPDSSTLLKEIIRVDHAGEYGAKRIYEGQLQALKYHPSAPVIEHMYAQELHHLKTFDDLMKQHNVRPTFFSPLWHGAAYALGWVSGKLGMKTAMAVTVAVEEVIDAHYAQQLQALRNYPEEQALAQTIEVFRQEECDHRDQGLEHQAQQAPCYPLIKTVVKGATKLAIFLSKRW